MHPMLVAPTAPAQAMLGHLEIDGQLIMSGGFMRGHAGHGMGLGVPHQAINAPAQAIIERGEQPELAELIARGDWNQAQSELLQAVTARIQQIERAGIVSTQTAFPVRENLESPARLLVPIETPLRNRIARVRGSGLASLWRQLTSLGGGWGPNYDQPGGGSAAQMFFAETGAPATLASVYAAKSAAYKLLGAIWSVTGLAMAGGANFQPQRATEMRNAIWNLMLNEENAIVNGNSTATSAPWGDGSNALAFDGLLNLVTVANGTPAAQVQTSVGALTTAHIGQQLRRIWTNGARNPWIVMNGSEQVTLNNLVTASGSIIRLTGDSARPVTAIGNYVLNFLHPMDGTLVPLLVSKFMPQGTMIFGCDYLPDGSPALDVEVLPQVELPQLAPNEMIQGYVSQELAPVITAPHVYPGIVSVYEVLRLKSAIHFAKSSGISA